MLPHATAIDWPSFHQLRSLHDQPVRAVNRGLACYDVEEQFVLDATLAYKLPGHVFAPYFTEGGTELADIADNLTRFSLQFRFARLSDAKEAPPPLPKRHQGNFGCDGIFVLWPRHSKAVR